MNGLAGLYAGGFGVRLDFREAVRWYAMAARRGHVTAQLNLGDYYARGRGVRRDLVAAHMWLTLAAKQGNDWAEARRRVIARRMTPTQLAAAAARVKAFQPR
jgi:TPR repeat protein